MALKVFISGMSGNKEVKKRQQRVLMILDSKNIKYDIIDITEPGKESEKEFMQTKSTSNGATVSDTDPRHPLPPQIFNEDEYCGDYDAFDLANEVDTLEQFLKLAPADTTAVSSAHIELKKENGEAKTENEDGENKENEDKKDGENAGDGGDTANDAKEENAGEDKSSEDKADAGEAGESSEVKDGDDSKGDKIDDSKESTDATAEADTKGEGETEVAADASASESSKTGEPVDEADSGEKNKDTEKLVAFETS